MASCLRAPKGAEGFCLVPDPGNVKPSGPPPCLQACPMGLSSVPAFPHKWCTAMYYATVNFLAWLRQGGSIAFFRLPSGLVFGFSPRQRAMEASASAVKTALRTNTMYTCSTLLVSLAIKASSQRGGRTEPSTEPDATAQLLRPVATTY